MVTPSSSAVSVRSPTAFALVNGVGGNATRPSSANSPASLVEGLLRVAGHVLGRDVEERGQGRRGVLRVGVDLAVLQRLEGDRLVAEVEVRADVVAGGLQPLGVDLAEDELLGEVLRADRDRDPVVVGVLLDQVRAGVAAAARRRRRRHRRRRFRRTRANAAISANSSAQTRCRLSSGLLSRVRLSQSSAAQSYAQQSYAAAAARCSAHARAASAARWTAGEQ